jgi:hypothetical protein
LLQAVLATALVTYKAKHPQELSYDKGDLIEIQRDIGEGIVFGSNVSQASVTGTIALRNIELNLQTRILEATQLAVEEVLLAKRELAELRQRREDLQLEVIEMRDAKEKLLTEVNPIRFAVRQVSDLLLHLTQTDIELVEVNELVREVQNDWNGIVTDINRLQTTIDDPELDPFRRLVLDRCDGLKKRVVALQSPASGTIASCKMLHVDLENVWNALNGLPMIPRPAASSEHLRSTSTGAISVSPLLTSIRSPLSGSTSSLGGSFSSLPEYRDASSSSTSGTSSDYILEQGRPTSPGASTSPRLGESSGIAGVNSSPGLGIEPRTSSDMSSPVPRYIERTGLLGGQRLRGSSPALVTSEATTPSVSALRQAPSSGGSPGSGFVPATKPGSSKMRLSPGQGN